MLLSGRGSNLKAIIGATRSGTIGAMIALVISNRADAPGLQRARDAGLDARFVDPREYRDREAYDTALADLLRAHGVTLVCLAGFMRLVSAPLLDAFPAAILNIHPSLLPSFPGLDAPQQALDYGVRVSGATVHFVTSALDGGPIVLQAAVPVRDDDTAATLSARILLEEHRLYPEAIRVVLEERWSIERRRFVRAARRG